MCVHGQDQTQLHLNELVYNILVECNLALSNSCKVVLPFRLFEIATQATGFGGRKNSVVNLDAKVNIKR